MKSRTLIAAAVASLMAGTALANDNTGYERSGATFNTLDVNADGRISKTEASLDKKLGERFSQQDANSDGYIDAAEFITEGRESQKPESIPSSQSPQSSSPNSPGTSSKTDPNMPQGQQPSGNRERSSDTETPRQ